MSLRYEPSVIGAPRRPGGSAWWRGWTRPALAAVAVAALVVVTVAGSWPYRAPGIGDPGSLVRLGAPVLRLAVDVSATVCVGALVFAAFFTRAQPSGEIAPAGYAALCGAGRAAVVWFVAALALWPFDAAATFRLALRRVLTPTGLRVLTGASEGPKAWLLVAAIAAVVAVGCRWTLRWRPTLALTGLAVFGVLPPQTAGHSASDTGHDIATAVIMIHVPAAVIWVGALFALLRGRGLGADAAPAAARYRRLAGWCWWVVALSGVVDAAILAPGTTAFSTGYGAALVTKLAIMILVGGLLLRLRRAAAARARPVWLAVELVALAAAFGVSAALAYLPAPKFTLPVSAEQMLLGYDLSAAPTWARLLLDWRVEALFAPLCVLLSAGYLRGVRRLRRAGQGWPAGRSVMWLSGCVLLLLTTSSGLGRYAPAMFSLEAVAHMLVGMLVPLLLALGAPLALAAAALRPAPGARLPGLVEWSGAVRNWAPVRAGTHPLVAGVLFAGAPFLLYFTPAFDVAVRYHWAHLAMEVVFLVIGYLFAWVMVGPDPLPRPVPHLVRVGVLLAVMPADIVFAVAILASRHIIGNGAAGANMYSALALPWVPGLAADQRLGGYLALAIGEAVGLLMLVILLARWRPAARDADAAVYQAISDALAHRKGRLDTTPDHLMRPGRARTVAPEVVGKPAHGPTPAGHTDREAEPGCAARGAHASARPEGSATGSPVTEGAQP